VRGLRFFRSFSVSFSPRLGVFFLFSPHLYGNLSAASSWGTHGTSFAPWGIDFFYCAWFVQQLGRFAIMSQKHAVCRNPNCVARLSKAQSRPLPADLVDAAAITAYYNAHSDRALNRSPDRVCVDCRMHVHPPKWRLEHLYAHVTRLFIFPRIGLCVSSRFLLTPAYFDLFCVRSLVKPPPPFSTNAPAPALPSRSLQMPPRRRFHFCFIPTMFAAATTFIVMASGTDAPFTDPMVVFPLTTTSSGSMASGMETLWSRTPMGTTSKAPWLMVCGTVTVN
jgi:hypothetical protein